MKYGQEREQKLLLFLFISTLNSVRGSSLVIRGTCITRSNLFSGPILHTYTEDVQYLATLCYNNKKMYPTTLNIIQVGVH